MAAGRARGPVSGRARRRVAGCGRDRAGVVPADRHLGGAVPADWGTGRGAGFRRNVAMVSTLPDLCLAYIRDNSPGATHCARAAELAATPTRRERHQPGANRCPVHG